MKSIFIIDDEVDLLNIMTAILEKQGFQIYTANGVHAALKMLESTKVDVICSDFNLGDGTGLELLENLRRHNITTPFMLMSGNDDSLLEHRALELDGSFCCKTDYNLMAKIQSLAGVIPE